MLQKILMLIMKKPADKTIRTIKIIFALLYIASLSYAFFGLTGENSTINLVFFGNDLSDYKLYIEILFIAFGLPSLASGILDKNFLKSKHTRIMQIVFGIFIIYLCGNVIPVQNGLLDVTILLTIMGWFSIFSGIVGKLITKQGKRQGEKVTKVRV
ncbi:MAG: hypothetical protein N4A38_03565 [Candidatus Gracilibacteria bacterium]|nr:hypothetical protein [Candidatus Gracilibacteria bacterium]